MATPNKSTSPAAEGNSPSPKENVKPISARIAELNESRTELLNRIQSLKQDVNNWRSKLDTQFTVCRNELAELKKSLNTEVEQLRTEFQDLRTTLQQQQDDVSASLKNLGLHDVSKDAPTMQDKECDQSNGKDGNGGPDPEDKPKESQLVGSDIKCKITQTNDEEDTNC